MNKVFKVIWNEARNAYVVVSEIAKNHGSKSCSTKKLLAMLIATGVMTCASFDVLAAPRLVMPVAEPAAQTTTDYQYVALKAKEFNTRPLIGTPDREEYSAQRKGTKKIGDYYYKYDATNKYWVREGYQLMLEENGDMHTPLSSNRKSSDVAYIGGGDRGSILQSVTSVVSQSGTVTNMGESLNKITASAFAGVSHSGGTEVRGNWDYIIHDPSWKGHVVQGNYKDGYVDLVGSTMPKGFVTNGLLKWDDAKQTYTYNDKPVDYSNVYVINGKMGVFTNQDGSDFYKGTVFGKNNEILMTVKDDNGHFYSYWASEVTDPSATMSSYRLVEYKKDLDELVDNDKKLFHNDIKEVTLDTSKANSATIGLLRNGDTEAGAPVEGAITVTSGGGAGGKDTFVSISNGKVTQELATGSKVEAIGTKEATTGVKINGLEYKIKSGSEVEIKQDAAKKTTTITVDGNPTTITDTDTHNALSSAKLDGKKLTITGKDGDTASVDLSSIDTDTKYAAGNGIAINGENNAISVKLKTGEGNLVVDQDGLALNNNILLSGDNDAFVNISGSKGNIWASGSVEAGNVIMDGTTATVSGLGNQTTAYDGFANGKGKAATEEQLKEVATEAGKRTQVKAGTNVSVVPSETTDGTPVYTVNADGTTVSGDSNVVVTAGAKDANNVTNYGVKLNKDLQGIESISNGGANLALDGAAGTAGMINGKGASIFMKEGYTVINSKVSVDKDGKISGVAAGEVSSTSTDAINGSQLHKTNEDVAQNKADIAQNKADIAQNKADIAQNKADIAQNKADIAQNKADIAQNKADIAQNKADIAQNKTDIKNLDNRVTDVEKLAKKHTTVTEGDNITVTEDTNADGGKEYKVALDKDIKLDSVTTGQTVMNNDGLKVGDKVSVTATAVTAGKTSISDEGVKVGDKTYISDKGLNANDQKVTNVAAGELSATSKDAVNGSQLYATNQEVANNTNRITKLGSRVNKVGAGAAALAALHPMDFDPDDKLTFSAGYGNYGGENAAAIGAYYRPNEKVMFSVGGSFGGGENMVNAGVSFKFGDGKSTVGISRAAMANKIDSLEADNKTLTDTLAKQNQQIADQGKQLEEQSATIKEMQEQIQQLLKAQASK